MNEIRLNALKSSLYAEMLTNLPEILRPLLGSLYALNDVCFMKETAGLTNQVL